MSRTPLAGLCMTLAREEAKKPKKSTDRRVYYTNNLKFKGRKELTLEPWKKIWNPEPELWLNGTVPQHWVKGSVTISCPLIYTFDLCWKFLTFMSLKEKTPYRCILNSDPDPLWASLCYHNDGMTFYVFKEIATRHLNSDLIRGKLFIGKMVH